MEVINLKENYKNYTLTKNKFAINFLKKVLNDKLSNKEFIELFEELRKNSKDIGKDWNYLNDNVANEGGVDVGSDPGRSIVERGNNSLDSVMELLHELKKILQITIFTLLWVIMKIIQVILRYLLIQEDH